MQRPAHQRYKVVVVGVASPEKTTLVQKLAACPSLAQQYILPRSRLGPDFYTRTVSLREDTNITLQLWDVSLPDPPPSAASATTQQRPDLLAAYLHGSQAVLLLLDPTLSDAPRELPALVERCRAALACGQDGTAAAPYLALLLDVAPLLAQNSAAAGSLPTDNSLSPHSALLEQLAALCSSHALPVFWLSSASGEGVDAVAVRLAADLSGVPPSATDHSQLLLSYSCSHRAVLELLHPGAAANQAGQLALAARPTAPPLPPVVPVHAAAAAAAARYAVGEGRQGSPGSRLGSMTGASVRSGRVSPASAAAAGSRGSTPSPTPLLVVRKQGALGQVQSLGRLPSSSASVGGGVGAAALQQQGHVQGARSGDVAITGRRRRLLSCCF